MRKKKITSLLLALALFVQAIPAMKIEASVNEGGLIPFENLSEEDKQWYADNATDITSVQPNELGKERIGTLSNQRAGNGLPSAIDNSVLPAFPPITNQGMQNSCTSFATTYYQMTFMMAQRYGIDVKNSNDLSLRFSPQWGYTLINQGENNGTSFVDYFRLYKEVGVANLLDVPFNESEYKSWATNPIAWRNASLNKIDSFGAVNIGQGWNETIVTNEKDTDLDLVKSMLNNGHVLTFAGYNGYPELAKIKNNTESTLDDEYVGQSAIVQAKNTVYHAMTVVGYNDDLWIDINNNNIVDQGEKGAFKVANSWGKGYENDGFVWYSYDSLNKKSAVSGKVNDVNRTEGIINYTLNYIDVSKAQESKVMAEFTVNHSNRSDISALFGYGTPDFTLPEVERPLSNLLVNNGGNYSFDGTRNRVDSTFSIDFQEIIKIGRFNKDIHSRWFLTLTDRVNNEALIVKDFKLVDETGKVLGQYKGSLPKTINGTSEVFYIDYKITKDEPTLKAGSISATTNLSKDGKYSLTMNIPKYNTANKYELYEGNTLIKSGDLTVNKGIVQNIYSNVTKTVEGVFDYKVVLIDAQGNKIDSTKTSVTVDLPDPILAWQPGVSYKIGDKVTYNGKTYVCLIGHTSMVGWEPVYAAGLWR